MRTYTTEVSADFAKQYDGGEGRTAKGERKSGDRRVPRPLPVPDRGWSARAGGRR